MGVDHEHENARCIFLKQPIGVVNMSTEGLHQKMMNLKASVVLLVGGGKPLPLERPLCTPLVTNIAVARPIMKDSRSPSFGPSAKYGNTAQRSNSKDPGLTVTPWKINTIKLILSLLFYFIKSLVFIHDSKMNGFLSKHCRATSQSVVALARSKMNSPASRWP